MPGAELVVVAIPTCRRPRTLRRCLEALAEIDHAGPLRVIVAENDTVGREGLAVCEAMVAAGYRFPLQVVLAEERGVACARNALVRAAIADPEVSHIAMIDDDEWPGPDWLGHLLAVQRQEEADVVGGPVQRSYEVPPAPHVLKAAEGAYGALGTGRVDLVDATSNILFDAAVFRRRPDPWFDPAYTLLGGEDRDFLIGLALAGGVFAWSREAVVREDYPASRCSLGWMVRRAYRGGNTDMLINLKHRPPSFTLLREGSKIGGALGVSLLNMTLLAWKPERRVAGLLLLARVGGKLAGLAGLRYQEYRTIHGG
ncbi:glycosyltransferase family 2 protein [Aureimonas sp. AU40]|uniref:glycosyltransferase family 2 protein n=1 Tax=Aureimonas sp. AU40 TaxID=1637747 RepID=UPI00078046E8|nr:glycosyltransferase [Aureimonas sp. AU40]